MSFGGSAAFASSSVCVFFLRFRLGLFRLGLFGRFFEQRVFEELLVEDFLELEFRQLQQLDRLLQRRRHDQFLREFEVEFLF